MRNIRRESTDQKLVREKMWSEHKISTWGWETKAHKIQIETETMTCEFRGRSEIVNASYKRVTMVYQTLWKSTPNSKSKTECKHWLWEDM